MKPIFSSITPLQSSSDPELMIIRDEITEPDRRKYEDPFSVVITAAWLAEQVTDYLSEAQATYQNAVQVSDEAKSAAQAIWQDHERRARLYGEKLLELAIGSYAGAYCLPVPISLERFRDRPNEYAEFAKRLIDALSASDELEDREALFLERNRGLIQTWNAWFLFLPDFSTHGKQERLTDLLASWKPQFDLMYEDFCQKAQAIGERARDWHEQRFREINTQSIRSDTYLSPTTQEFDALHSAAAHGKSGRYYNNDSNALVRVHKTSRSDYYVKVGLTQQEIDDGCGIAELEAITGSQDADCIFALDYIWHLLQPRQDSFAGGWIDLNDVIAKIGWNPRPQDREEARKQVWAYIRFGERAHVIGKRTIDYIDKATGQKIETQIESPLWKIMATQRPSQPHLFPVYEIPVRAEIVLSRQWQELMSNPNTAQFLPRGELLSSIPANQPGGAWARTIGLTLAGFWRRNPRETLTSGIKPTRRELLTRFPPKTGSALDVLNGGNPKRAVEYWVSALGILANTGYLAREGEALQTASNIQQRLPRYEWRDKWLDETVELFPGTEMEPVIRAAANKLPLLRPPCDLPGKRRPGRPRKTQK